MLNIGDEVLVIDVSERGQRIKTKLAGLPNKLGGCCVIGADGERKYARMANWPIKGARTTPKNELPGFLTRSAKR